MNPVELYNTEVVDTFEIQIVLIRLTFVNFSATRHSTKIENYIMNYMERKFLRKNVGTVKKRGNRRMENKKKTKN